MSCYMLVYLPRINVLQINQEKGAGELKALFQIQRLMGSSGKRKIIQNQYGILRTRTYYVVQVQLQSRLRNTVQGLL